MEIPITLEKLLEAYPALERLGGRDGLKPAPAWWLAKTLRTLRPDYESLAERRQALFEKYGISVSMPDANGQVRDGWMVRVGSETQFQTELRPLLDTVTTVVVTTHRVEWVGVANSIEPDILHRLDWLFDPRPASGPTLEISLSRRDAEEAYQAALAVATYRMSEALGWWVADLLAQLEAESRATARRRQALMDELCRIKEGERQFTPEYRKANDALGRDGVVVYAQPRPLSDFGDLTEKWPPTLVAALMPFLLEPVEPDQVEGIDAPPAKTP